MKTIAKNFETEVTVTDSESGTFEAIVSVTGIEDSQGDIVEPGAFKKTLAEWQVKDRPIPSLWSHQWSNPFSFIGQLTFAEETDRGLHVKGQLDMSNRTAVQVHALMQKGLVVEFSISGAVRESTLEENDEGRLIERITDIDLWEAGPTFKGANPETELISIKDAPAALAKALGALAAGMATASGREELAPLAGDLDATAKALTSAAGALKVASSEDPDGEDPDDEDDEPDGADDPDGTDDPDKPSGDDDEPTDPPEPPDEADKAATKTRLRKARGLFYAAATASAQTTTA